MMVMCQRQKESKGESERTSRQMIHKMTQAKRLQKLWRKGQMISKRKVQRCQKITTSKIML